MTVPRTVSAATWLGLGLVVGSFTLYAATLTPGVPPTDSGELALAAWLPGVAHAPGFPSFLVIGWLWSHLLPFGRVIWRLNLLSAVGGALAVGLTYALALRSLAGSTGRQPRTTLAAAAAGALALGLGRTVWSWSTIAEVYALNTALVAAILLLVVWDVAKVAQRTREPLKSQSPKSSRRRAAGRPEHTTRPTSHTARFTQPDRPLLLAAWLFAFGLGGHLTSIVLLGPGIAVWLTIRRGWRFWVSRVAWLGALALLAGAAIYLYLPLIAVTDPLLNWGQPDTWQRFWWHVTAKQYRVSLLSAPVWPQVRLAGQLWWTQFTPVGLALLLLGAWHMAKMRRPLFWMLLLVVVLTTLYAWAYVIEDDGDAYYLPAFVAGAVWVAWGAQAFVAWLSNPKRSRVVLRPGPAALGLCLLLPMVALVMNWSTCNRQADTISEDYARDTFAEIAPGGLLLTRDWQLYAPALYLQQVEGLRPDVTVVDMELLRRGWYFSLLKRVDPALMNSVASEERVFLALRDAWERGEIPDTDPRIARLQASYVELIDAFIRQASAAGRPVHVGPNRGALPLRAATLNGQPDMEPGVGTGWRWLPTGLTFRATASTAASPLLAPLTWQIASFEKVTLTAPEQKVQASRSDMAFLRSRYQMALGNQAGAEADLQVALAVDPQHGPAAELLDRLRAVR